MEAMTSEREAFEVSVRQWPTFKDSFLAHDGRYPDYYGNPVVQGAWEGWKARAHLAQPAQAVDVGVIHAYMDDKGDVVSAEMIEWYRANYGEDCSAVKRWTIPLTRALSGEKAGPAGDGWQPIETAPKDGTSVLLAFGGKKPVGGWWNDDRYAKVPRPYWSTDNERIVGIPWLRSNPPIAWMPLPASPTPDKEGA